MLINVAGRKLLVQKNEPQGNVEWGGDEMF